MPFLIVTHSAPGAAATPTVLKAIGDWARPQLAQVDERDAFQIHWLVLPLRFYVQDAEPNASPVTIQLETDDEAVAIEAGGGAVAAWIGRLGDPDLVLSGPARVIGRLMLGRIDLAEARKLGVKAEGDLAVLRRLRVRDPEDAEPVQLAAR